MNHQSLNEKSSTDKELPIATEKNKLTQYQMEGTLSGPKEQEDSALVTKQGVSYMLHKLRINIRRVVQAYKSASSLK